MGGRAAKGPGRRTPVLLKAAVAALAGAVLVAVVVIVRLVGPEPEPAAIDHEPFDPPEPEPVAAPAPPPPAPQAVAPPPVPAQPVPPPSTPAVPVDAVPEATLEDALMAETDPARKRALIARVQRKGHERGLYALATFFTDADPQVRIEAIRALRAMDHENRVLLAKTRAVYMYEQDPAVKAELQVIIDAERAREEAAARAAAAGMGGAPGTGGAPPGTPPELHRGGPGLPPVPSPSPSPEGQGGAAAEPAAPAPAD